MTKRLQSLHLQSDDLHEHLSAVGEQWATVTQERLGVSAEYRLLAGDAGPMGWTHRALEDERALLHAESALGREWLRLLVEQSRIQQELVGLLFEQADLLHAASAPYPWWRGRNPSPHRRTNSVG